MIYDVHCSFHGKTTAWDSGECTRCYSKTFGDKDDPNLNDIFEEGYRIGYAVAVKNRNVDQQRDEVLRVERRLKLFKAKAENAAIVCALIGVVSFVTALISLMLRSP